MAIKGGQIIHDIRGFIVDRVQTGGISSLNIPQEIIYELGNYQAVATIRDIPDLQFDIDGLDVSTELEALIVGKTGTALSAGQFMTFDQSIPMDVISPFKAGAGAFNIVQGIVIPWLTLSSAAYKFGVGVNSGQTFQFKGDSVYYVPGSPYYESKTITSGTAQTYSLNHTAIVYHELGQTIYVLGVCVKNPTTGLNKRLIHGASSNGYTDSATTVTVAENLFTEGYTELDVCYGSLTPATYPQNVNATAAVKPAAVRGKDIALYVSDGAATPTLLRWAGVQTVDITRSVNLTADQELDNQHYVDQDYDVPDVKGTISVRSFDLNDLYTKINQVANVTTGEVIGPYSSQPLQLLIKIKDPNTGLTLKTINVPDARFTIPNVSGKANAKLDVTFPFESDTGQMQVYNGDKP